MRPDYAYAIATAQEALYELSVIDFPLDVVHLEYQPLYHIVFDTFDNYARLTGGDPRSRLTARGRLRDGYLVKKNSKNIVLYDPQARTRAGTGWTITHEVAHVWLGHTTDEDAEETEANWFTSEFLAPSPLLYEIHQRGYPINIACLQHGFGLSRSASEIRLERFHTQCDRITNGQCVDEITSELSCKLLRQFSLYLNERTPCLTFPRFMDHFEYLDIERSINNWYRYRRPISAQYTHVAY